MLALIIEDHAAIAQLYAESLHNVGFETERIEDGRAAMDRLDSGPPDLIVLDMNLPHVSGHYLLKQMRADPTWADVPVIIATANAVMAEALESQLGPHDMILIKPIRPAELVDIAQQLCSS